MLVDIIGDNANAQWFESMKPLIDGIKLYLTREGPFLLKQIFDVITTQQYGGFHTSWVRHPQKLPISITTSVCQWLNNSCLHTFMLVNREYISKLHSSNSG